VNTQETPFLLMQGPCPIENQVQVDNGDVRSKRGMMVAKDTNYLLETLNSSQV